ANRDHNDRGDCRDDQIPACFHEAPSLSQDAQSSGQCWRLVNVGTLPDVSAIRENLNHHRHHRAKSFSRRKALSPHGKHLRARALKQPWSLLSDNDAASLTAWFGVSPGILRQRIPNHWTLPEGT